jgi:hypothetical protein
MEKISTIREKLDSGGFFQWRIIIGVPPVKSGEAAASSIVWGSILEIDMWDVLWPWCTTELTSPVELSPIQ